MSCFEKDCKKYNFTNSQKIAVSEAIDFIATPFNDKKFIIGISGAGGTGKTYITNYIINNCKFPPSLIKCCSPTHKACRVFSQSINNKPVYTIQSMFGFRLNLKLEDFNPNNPQFDPMGAHKLDNTKLLIIDEVSMIPKGIVNYIYKVCKEEKIKIIGLGDTYQLAPVNEHKSLFFTKCFKIFELTEIVRQEVDNPISKLLVLLRNDIKNHTYKFIEFLSKNIGNYEYNELGKGWCCVNSIQFKDYINNSFRDEEYTKNIDLYRIIGYTNKNIADWNHYVRNEIILDSNKIITRNDLIMSYETIVDDFLNTILHNSEEYIINDIVDYVEPKYKLKGFIVKLQLVNGGRITKPMFIIDHNDMYSIQLYYKTVNELMRKAKNASGSTRASKWKQYFDFKKNYLILANIIDRNGKIIINRDIDYGFAITAHKSQGSTYNTVFVDVNNIIYDKNNKPYNNQDDLLRRLYVACSRARNNLILCFGK